MSNPGHSPAEGALSAASMAPPIHAVALTGGPRTAGRRQAAAPSRALAAARMAAALFIGATVIYGIAIGGFAGRMAERAQEGVRSAMQHAGFVVQRLEIEGSDKTTREDIVEALGFSEGVPILSVDGTAAKEKLEQLSWVRHAKVMRFLPSTVQVVIEERVPFAVWQIDGKMHLIDVEGSRIAAVAREDYADLPLVVGKGAPDQASPLLEILKSHPELHSRVMAAVRVGERRWTLKLNNGIEIKLPEERIAGALDRLAELDQMRNLLTAEIESIDLRLGDRISVRLDEKAAAAREALRKDAAKSRAKASAQGT